ncbi:MAG: PD40 domain-containing protein [Actinobacteria bacterium]|nr:PD40 domain-containing protein [Actinomycetota bacterium]
MSWGLPWSPDGSKLAFQSDRDGQSEIYVMNPDGTGQPRLTNDPGNDTSPAWSADGSTILFTTDRDGVGADRKIFVMNPDGTGRHH